jgi:hypothetical protein
MTSIKAQTVLWRRAHEMRQKLKPSAGQKKYAFMPQPYWRPYKQVKMALPVAKRQENRAVLIKCVLNWHAACDKLTMCKNVNAGLIAVTGPAKARKAGAVFFAPWKNGLRLHGQEPFLFAPTAIMLY